MIKFFRKFSVNATLSANDNNTMTSTKSGPTCKMSRFIHGPFFTEITEITNFCCMVNNNALASLLIRNAVPFY